MKVIIPVAGKGTRLRPHTFTTPKPLIQVAGKAIICHVIESIQDLGIDEVILVISPEGEDIVSFVKEKYPFKVGFVYQEESLGLGHAIYMAKEMVNKDEGVVVILGDTIIEVDLPRKKEIEDFIAVKKVSDPRRFGIVVLDEEGRIIKVVEKPDTPVSDLAIVGLYYFGNAELLFESLEYIIKNDIRTKGEYQLTDAIARMIDRGWKAKPLFVKEWYDCGTVSALLETNKMLLQKYHKEVKFPGSLVIPPCYFDEGIVIENSLIGPYVTIGKRAKISNAIISNSIIGEEAEVENITITSSLIGKRAYLKGVFKRVNLGDYSELIED
ncbi:MAG TPA: nucleotidyl transferase [candidate division WOR-3 bacterium]|uniref:Nucleotidyl transferase n=1 Tax=candidate division WOR-3 bacterium TaxID=2052148 RepID=A0A7V5LTR3_UNCW3|nr:nucleotidyl transferase [candidate division WOR-3 bacterium]